MTVAEFLKTLPKKKRESMAGFLYGWHPCGLELGEPAPSSASKMKELLAIINQRRGYTMKELAEYSRGFIGRTAA